MLISYKIKSQMNTHLNNYYIFEFCFTIYGNYKSILSY